MSDGLVEFLRARLDEDEQIARRACEYAEAEWRLDEEFGETVLWWPPEPHIAEKEREKGLPVVSDHWRGQTIDSHIAPHIARHDPARILAEVDAKRQIVTSYEAVARSLSSAGPGTPPHDLLTGATNLMRNTLQHLALPYAEHPDYRVEWRP
ncbi:DUF6221 family protein [Streptomyces asiaticus]|uniref:DUF6221 family protein n=1 Tax=Streptomyces asiaticus TaxID=114695 RepID=UPI001BAA40D1|nr:DUF6221 family protein [Streptomyces asiaticus]